MAKKSEVDKAVHRAMAQQRRSKRKQASARRKQKAEDRKDNLSETAYNLGSDLFDAAQLGVIGLLPGMAGGLAAGQLARGGIKGARALSKTKAARKLLGTLKKRSPVKLKEASRRKLKSAKRKLKDYEKEVIGEEIFVGAPVGAAAVGGQAGGMAEEKQARAGRRAKARERRRKSSGIKGY